MGAAIHGGVRRDACATSVPSCRRRAPAHSFPKDALATQEEAVEAWDEAVEAWVAARRPLRLWEWAEEEEKAPAAPRALMAPLWHRSKGGILRGHRIEP